MDPGFFGTKYFTIAAVASTIVLAGAGSAYYFASFGVSHSSWDACDAPTIPGSALVVAPVRLVERDGRRVTQSYALDAAAFEGGGLDLCVEVGEILVEPSADANATLEVVTTADVARIVETTIVEARFHADGSRLIVAVWEATRGETGSWMNGNSASVRVVLRIPDSGVYDVHAVNDVGDVRVSGLMIEEPTMVTDVGTIIVREVDVLGNVTLTADVGDAILHALSVTAGAIRVTSDIGNAEANLPQRADVGYDAKATTDVGDAHIQIGDTEAYDSEADGAGEIATARTSGFATKPTRVSVEVATDVGDARIVAS